MDFSIRDDTNETVFASKGQNLGVAIRQLERFLEEKYGIKGFSAHDFGPYPKKKKKQIKERFW